MLDLVREVTPPFSPAHVVRAFAATMRPYVRTATSDRYAGGWPSEAFRKEGIDVRPSERTRSQCYLALLPMITSGHVELLDHPKMLKQFASLERRKGRAGADHVDAPPGGRHHEDIANAAAGALVLADVGRKSAVATIQPGETFGTDDVPDTLAAMLKPVTAQYGGWWGNASYRTHRGSPIFDASDTPYTRAWKARLRVERHQRAAKQAAETATCLASFIGPSLDDKDK